MNDKNHGSRRSFLQKAGLGALGLAAAPAALESCSPQEASTAKPAPVTTPSSIITRKNIADLPENDPEVQLFKDAVRILKERSELSPLDPSGWQAHGMLHSQFCATSIYANQVHYNWYVWPWHRLYLWSMEQKLQKAVGEPQLALHYWDWTKGENKIPALYFGDNNPLNNVTRQVDENDEIPKDFINVGAGFRASNFKTFGGYPAIRKKGEPQLDGLAEQSFHNNLHNWIGGQMATFVESGFDTIFYGHHGNCDRIFEAWQHYSPDNKLPDAEEWLEKRLFSTDGYGTPVDFKIKDLLDTEALGYRFADLDLNPDFCNPFVEADMPKRETVAGELTAPVNMATSDSDAIYMELIEKDRCHVILHFERAQLPYQPYCARVFFDYDNKSHYTGTFTILPILELDSVLLAQGVHLQIEVDKHLADAIEAKKPLAVTFQPVPLPNRNIPDEVLKLENISLKLPDA